MKVSAQISTYRPQPVAMRCPGCRKNGTFTGITADINDAGFQGKVTGPGGREDPAGITAGLRVCPNPACQELVFVINANGRPAVSYPAERLDFDPANIPTRIVESLEEALTDHVNQCYKSAAIMVRRTLEEICADRGATGKDLKARLAALGNTIIVPQALLHAADELRILGNDAAHLEAKVYDDVGKEEAELAIELCKELLKATYQFEDLLGRLRALKKPAE